MWNVSNRLPERSKGRKAQSKGKLQTLRTRHLKDAKNKPLTVSVHGFVVFFKCICMLMLLPSHQKNPPRPPVPVQRVSSTGETHKDVFDPDFCSTRSPTSSSLPPPLSWYNNPPPCFICVSPPWWFPFSHPICFYLSLSYHFHYVYLLLLLLLLLSVRLSKLTFVIVFRLTTAIIITYHHHPIIISSKQVAKLMPAAGSAQRARKKKPCDPLLMFEYSGKKNEGKTRGGGLPHNRTRAGVSNQDREAHVYYYYYC